MAAQPGHMQATNDVISVGICSVVAAAICTAACERRDGGAREQDSEKGADKRGREGEWWLTEADQDMVAKSNSRAGQNFCFYLFTCPVQQQQKKKEEKTRQTINNVTEAGNTLQKLTES